MTELLEIRFFELQKIKEKDADSYIMFWLEFINNPESKKIKGMYRLEVAYQEAKETYEKAIADPNIQEMIRIQEKTETNYKDALAHAMDNGREKGKAEGIREGRGKEAREKAVKTARNLLKMSLPIEQVVQATSLLAEEVKRGKNKNISSL